MHDTRASRYNTGQTNTTRKYAGTNVQEAVQNRRGTGVRDHGVREK